MEPQIPEVQWEDLALPRVPQAPAPAPARRPDASSELPASYLTHELRAPVTAIRLGLEILQEQIQERLAADEKQMLSLAVKNTARLEGLVNDIMDFSKIVAGRMKVQKSPVDARELLDEAVDSMRSVAISHGVKLVREDGEPLPRVDAEGRRVVQILVNLISNAIKFTPARGSVTVSAQKGRYEHDGTILFKVKDTGRGIPAEDIEKIFDMFIQAAGPKPAPGTGLGLTLAKMMVGLHGGRIWAESWKGIGATFYFTIPIAAQDLSKKVAVYPQP